MKGCLFHSGALITAVGLVDVAVRLLHCTGHSPPLLRMVLPHIGVNHVREELPTLNVLVLLDFSPSYLYVCALARVCVLTCTFSNVLNDVRISHHVVRNTRSSCRSVVDPEHPRVQQ